MLSLAKTISLASIEGDVAPKFQEANDLRGYKSLGKSSLLLSRRCIWGLLVVGEFSVIKCVYIKLSKVTLTFDENGSIDAFVIARSAVFLRYPCCFLFADKCTYLKVKKMALDIWKKSNFLQS